MNVASTALDAHKCVPTHPAAISAHAMMVTALIVTTTLAMVVIHLTQADVHAVDNSYLH